MPYLVMQDSGNNAARATDMTSALGQKRSFANVCLRQKRTFDWCRRAPLVRARAFDSSQAGIVAFAAIDHPAFHHKSDMLQLVHIG